MRTAIRDHRPCHERDETVCVQVLERSGDRDALEWSGLYRVSAFFVWLTLRQARRGTNGT